jgi:hypothetical protein
VTLKRCSARIKFGVLRVGGGVSLTGVSASRLDAVFRVNADWTPV